MTRSTIHLRAIVTMAIGFALLAASGARAEFPEPINNYVNDYAGALSTADAEAIYGMFEYLEEQTKMEATVVTMKSMDQYAAGYSSIESFATDLFNDWGIGNLPENTGVLILVCVQDRECRIELGGGFKRQHDAMAKRIIDDRMIPYFKGGDYSRGIYEGARGVIDEFTQEVSFWGYYKWHIIGGVFGFLCVIAGVSCAMSGKKGWGWKFFGIILAVFGVVLMILSVVSAITGNSGSG